MPRLTTPTTGSASSRERATCRRTVTSCGTCCSAGRGRVQRGRSLTLVDELAQWQKHVYGVRIVCLFLRRRGSWTYSATRSSSIRSLHGAGVARPHWHILHSLFRSATDALGSAHLLCRLQNSPNLYEFAFSFPGTLRPKRVALLLEDLRLVAT
jgi:hypothetical protein